MCYPQDKLAELKHQLSQLQSGLLPDYAKRLRRLDTTYRERKRINNIIRDLEVDMVEQEFIHEKKSAAREFEEHKVYLREQLIAELEEKLKLIENERHGMELTGDSMELKTISTRKLRRRANEPSSKYKLCQPLSIFSMSFPALQVLVRTEGLRNVANRCNFRLSPIH